MFTNATHRWYLDCKRGYSSKSCISLFQQRWRNREACANYEAFKHVFLFTFRRKKLWWSIEAKTFAFKTAERRTLAKITRQNAGRYLELPKPVLTINGQKGSFKITKNRCFVENLNFRLVYLGALSLRAALGGYNPPHCRAAPPAKCDDVM